MRISLYLFLTLFLLLMAYFVFRIMVRRDYLKRGRLTKFSSFLELLVFGMFMSFPVLYNPPAWAWFWRINRSSSSSNMIIGFVVIMLGFFVAFGIMSWFGVRRAFGLQADGLIRTGPYRISRNPQILGGYLLVIGVFIQWPSWYSLGWVILYGVICHMMVLTEEEYLGALYGESYKRFRSEVPRYLFDLEYKRSIE